MFCLLLIAAISRAEAIEILQFIDSDEYAPYLQDASGENRALLNVVFAERKGIRQQRSCLHRRYSRRRVHR